MSYSVYEDIDILGNDIACFADQTAVNVCQVECNKLNDCVAVVEIPNLTPPAPNIWDNGRSGCCYKNKISNIRSFPKVKTHLKNNAPLPMETGWNSDGEGNLAFLDRHPVNCGSTGIQRFKYNQDGKGNIRYTYDCFNIPNATDKRPEDKTTGFQPIGSGTNFLDRHNVDCGTSAMLSGFRFQVDGKGNMGYNYTCTPAKDTLKCRDTSTKLESWGNVKSFALEKHNVACEKDEVITRFHLQNSGANHTIHYRCCKK